MKNGSEKAKIGELTFSIKNFHWEFIDKTYCLYSFHFYDFKNSKDIFLSQHSQTVLWPDAQSLFWDVDFLFPGWINRPRSLGVLEKRLGQSHNPGLKYYTDSQEQLT